MRTQQSDDVLFAPYSLGNLVLKNRIVMAPMTRNRATGNLVSSLQARYYAARAEAGLIVTEATAPSPDALGYPRIPALFTDAHVSAWREVTRAVHDRGGTLFVQLMHVGRVAHPDNQPPGARILAPSSVAAPGAMHTDRQGPQPLPTPVVMEEADIVRVIEEHARASELAMDAGFDGVELHGANGFLIDQFLNSVSNQRTDAWGGPPENRARFGIEVARALTRRIGPERVGVRLSPGNTYNGMALDPDRDAVFERLAAAFDQMGLLYVHLVDFGSFGLPGLEPGLRDRIRTLYRGTLILSGGFDHDRARAYLQSGRCDLIAFGRPFIANPGLVSLLKSGAPLRDADPGTFYSAGPEGYVDP